MYTHYSRKFTEEDKKFLKAFISQYRDKFIKHYFSSGKIYSNADGCYYLGYRVLDDDQVFQALCMNLEGKRTLVPNFMIEIDNRDNREHHLKEAFKNAASSDYYYAFDKDYDGGIDLADAYVLEESLGSED